METFFSEEWLKQLGQAGFPTILTVYLLTRFERKFDELSKLIQRLVAAQKNDESD
ncbi:YvrJ family protein [Bacillus safensis]|uniref:YvrJ family protein n=1 Tax=Bacillus australimaris TaxID=1326968 RepID=A0ABD4QPL7_9BACI|nr:MULTISPECIES: YvrJ family protein [Bacillus]MBR8691674.1 YvrJ family protein [Bacillus australimaris]MCY7585887.1 YvrJ family protein [Bacillus safensis]MCY7589466.1 YvrJ family protein [Bacillus safensis]MCY7611579.1 YvrJ family protein [Bacillus safensis]MED1578499.1 YvrJ family protein [Bacillus safensis]